MRKSISGDTTTYSGAKGSGQPERVTDERLAEILATAGHKPYIDITTDELISLATELQRRREAEAGAREALIKRMVDRFLGWKLPEDFSPDGGISFEKAGNAGTTHEYTREPMGTNLLDAVQATAMVRYMLNGGDGPSLQPAIDRLIEIEKTTGVAPMAASPSSPASGVRVKAWSDGFIGLQLWRDEDNEDAITLTRDDIISLIEDYRSALGEQP